MVFDLEKARKIVDAMSPTPWIVLEDRYGQIDVIRNPNHPMHEEGVIELWGRASETATPDAIGISYMRSEFPNALDEIERLRGYEIAARDLSADLTKVAGDRDEQAAKIRELEDVHKRSGVKYAKIINELRSSVYANIPGLKKQWDEILNAPANGKIGPDANPHDHTAEFFRPNKSPAKSWQITEERKAALWHAINVLKENDIMEEPEEHLWDEEVTVLQAMLTEADHDKP